MEKMKEMKEKMLKVKNDQQLLQELLKGYFYLREEETKRDNTNLLNMNREQLAEWLAAEHKMQNNFYLRPSRQELKDLDSFTYDFYHWDDKNKNLELLNIGSVYEAMKRMISNNIESSWLWRRHWQKDNSRDESKEKAAYKIYEDKREELSYLKALDERHLHLAYSFLLGNSYLSLEPHTLKEIDGTKLTAALDYLLDKKNKAEQMLWNISYRTIIDENDKIVAENRKKAEIKKYKRFEELTGKTSRVRAVKVRRV